ncbi:aspartic peptidase domain-containing protein [Mycena galopus ATCC 62051]|nr:aspartic peptidase domain-containing protein [Mycena galopus ATCC 62051]
MLVDSGSADMWVGGEQCRGYNNIDCGDHTFLGPNSSSSFKNIGTPWGIQYGSGSASGTLVNDTVKFGNLPSLQNHTFGVTTYESPEFTDSDVPSDGVLGCGKENLSMQQTPTFLSAMRAAGLIAESTWSYSLGRKSDGENDGELTAGGMDPSKYDPSHIVRVDNVNEVGFWEVEMDTVTVNGQDVDLSNRSCILDTGTTFIIAPEEDVDAIHKYIPEAKFDNSSNTWTVPCNTTASVALSIGGQPFVMKPEDLAFPVDNTTSVCRSTIAAGGGRENPTQWLCGGAFLKNVYLSTNEDTNNITLARLAT